VSHYTAIIKVNTFDPPERQAREIEDGIGYACALLHDEYGRTVREIADMLERVADNVEDDEIRAAS